MTHVDRFNSYKLSRLIQRIQYLSIAVVVILTGLTCFFATRWVGAINSDLTYFVTPEGSYCSRKREQSIRREPFEIENFTIQFLKNAFEHNEYTYQSNLLSCLQVMDKKSGLLLKSKYNEEEVFQVYKTYNGVSTLSVEQIHTQLMDYPYEVVAFYTTTLQFLGLAGKKLSGLDHQELPGGVYFKLKTTHRSKENPYGLVITEFCFVDPKNKHDYVQNNR